MTYNDFELPSETASGDGGSFPAVAQLQGRLLHVFPTRVERAIVTKNRATPHDRLTCDVTFLDGPPIVEKISQDGDRTPFDAPINPGETMRGMYLSQSWFVSRLANRVGEPGFPGMVGVLNRVNLPNGRRMWMLDDPSREQLQSAVAWFRHRNEKQQSAPVAEISRPADSRLQQAVAEISRPADSPWSNQQGTQSAPPPWMR